MTQAHSGFTLLLKETLLKQAANYNSKLKGFCQEICQNSNGKNSHQSNFSMFSSYDIFFNTATACVLSCMLMRKSINSDVSKDSPIS